MGKTRKGVSNMGKAIEDLGTTAQHFAIILEQKLIPEEAFVKNYKGKKPRFKGSVLRKHAKDIMASYAMFLATEPQKPRKVSVTKKKIIENEFQPSLFSKPSFTKTSPEQVNEASNQAIPTMTVGEKHILSRFEAFATLFTSVWKLRHANTPTDLTKQIADLVAEFENEATLPH